MLCVRRKSNGLDFRRKKPKCFGQNHTKTVNVTKFSQRNRMSYHVVSLYSMHLKCKGYTEHFVSAQYVDSKSLYNCWSYLKDHHGMKVHALGDQYQLLLNKNLHLAFPWSHLELPSLKVSKFQKHFFLKLHCPKNEQNIRQNSAL